MVMNISTPGIEECKQVITELEKLRTRPKAGAIGDASPGHGLDVVSAANGIPGPVIDATGAPINSTLSASVIEEAEPDPAKEAAMQKTDMAMRNLQYYDSVASMKRILPAIVHPSQSVMVLVEAPTSKLRVVLEMMELTKDVLDALMTKEFCIAIPVGARIDLLSAVQNKSDMIWSFFECSSHIEINNFFNIRISVKSVHLPTPQSWKPVALGHLVALGCCSSIQAVLTSIPPESHQYLRRLADCFEPARVQALAPTCARTRSQ